MLITQEQTEQKYLSEQLEEDIVRSQVVQIEEKSRVFLQMQQLKDDFNQQIAINKNILQLTSLKQYTQMSNKIQSISEFILQISDIKQQLQRLRKAVQIEDSKQYLNIELAQNQLMNTANLQKTQMNEILQSKMQSYTLAIDNQKNSLEIDIAKGDSTEVIREIRQKVRLLEDENRNLKQKHKNQQLQFQFNDSQQQQQQNQSNIENQKLKNDLNEQKQQFQKLLYEKQKEKDENQLKIIEFQKIKEQTQILQEQIEIQQKQIIELKLKEEKQKIKKEKNLEKEKETFQNQKIIIENNNNQNIEDFSKLSPRNQILAENNQDQAKILKQQLLEDQWLNDDQKVNNTNQKQKTPQTKQKNYNKSSSSIQFSPISPKITKNLIPNSPSVLTKSQLQIQNQTQNVMNNISIQNRRSQHLSSSRVIQSPLQKRLVDETNKLDQSKIHKNFSKIVDNNNTIQSVIQDEIKIQLQEQVNILRQQLEDEKNNSQNQKILYEQLEDKLKQVNQIIDENQTRFNHDFMQIKNLSEESKKHKDEKVVLLQQIQKLQTQFDQIQQNKDLELDQLNQKLLHEQNTLLQLQNEKQSKNDSEQQRIEQLQYMQQVQQNQQHSTLEHIQYLENYQQVLQQQVKDNQVSYNNKMQALQQENTELKRQNDLQNREFSDEISVKNEEIEKLNQQIHQSNQYFASNLQKSLSIIKDLKQITPSIKDQIIKLNQQQRQDIIFQPTLQMQQKQLNPQTVQKIQQVIRNQKYFILQEIRNVKNIVEYSQIDLGIFKAQTNMTEIKQNQTRNLRCYLQQVRTVGNELFKQKQLIQYQRNTFDMIFNQIMQKAKQIKQRNITINTTLKKQVLDSMKIKISQCMNQLKNTVTYSKQNIQAKVFENSSINLQQQIVEQWVNNNHQKLLLVYNAVQGFKFSLNNIKQQLLSYHSPFSDHDRIRVDLQIQNYVNGHIGNYQTLKQECSYIRTSTKSIKQSILQFKKQQHNQVTLIQSAINHLLFQKLQFNFQQKQSQILQDYSSEQVSNSSINSDIADVNQLPSKQKLHSISSVLQSPMQSYQVSMPMLPKQQITQYLISPQLSIPKLSPKMISSDHSFLSNNSVLSQWQSSQPNMASIDEFKLKFSKLKSNNNQFLLSIKQLDDFRIHLFQQLKKQKLIKQNNLTLVLNVYKQLSQKFEMSIKQFAEKLQIPKPDYSKEYFQAVKNYILSSYNYPMEQFLFSQFQSLNVQIFDSNLQKQILQAPNSLQSELNPNILIQSLLILMFFYGSKLKNVNADEENVVVFPEVQIGNSVMQALQIKM